MKAMILAAGRGERMRPLTDHCPKPLLAVDGKPLIEHHIVKLAAIGITDIVINYAWLGDKIRHYLQDGKQWGVNIIYSDESSGALETAGGIKKALPLLGEAPFLVVNGDIYTDFDFNQLPELSADVDAHLWLVNNPEHNPQGDFALSDGKLVNKALENKDKCFTFSGIALYRPQFFHQSSLNTSVQPLAPMLRAAADQQKISATLLDNLWVDVGTPQRLSDLNKSLCKQTSS